MIKLSPFLFKESTEVSEVEELISPEDAKAMDKTETSDEEIEEANTLAGGNVVGYTAPLGAAGVGSSNALEKGFWRDQSGKKVKTASPALHKKKKTNETVDEVIQAVGIPTKKLNMVKLLWQEDDVDSHIKTASEPLHNKK